MNSEAETRAQAMINALSAQRTQAADQAVYVAADLAVANARIAQLEKQVAELTPKEPEA